MNLTTEEKQMLERIFDKGIYYLDRSYKLIGRGKEYVKVCEIPNELFPAVEKLLAERGYRLYNRDIANAGADITGGSIGRMLEGK